MQNPTRTTDVLLGQRAMVQTFPKHVGFVVAAHLLGRGFVAAPSRVDGHMRRAWHLNRQRRLELHGRQKARRAVARLPRMPTWRRHVATKSEHGHLSRRPHANVPNANVHAVAPTVAAGHRAVDRR
ncbi:hypothetical protein H310_14480 [Aphanomyces invadans]|uniref:Uncharacterized protein n=1 Tax=Aphanomyces invadans TaxID=157072 RepID=A0A024TB36_9STRA|nr:hypothetical protein H310_14480 [Aphanomyces invadans]ETV90816.1 hypothetical protein H310_14480 [Aphanomyces invadans]|eukprot:XP_008880573.1 hypothetical protein H310_14480 [Aphanomyces invadans]